MHAPFFREAGAAGAPTVLCLHSNASSSGQWRGLLEGLASGWRVLAPDLLGAGKSPPWPQPLPAGRARLDDEVALLAPLLDEAASIAPGGRLNLVGHSYGAALAMKIALLQPDRVASLALYEPTLFFLLEQQRRGHPATAGIAGAAGAASQAWARGDAEGAAGVFIDYWMGPGTWARMPTERQASVAASMRPIALWTEAVFGEPSTLDDLAQGLARLPMLLMTGGDSPPSTRESAALLASVLPAAQRLDFPGLGHMAPVTHPALVNDAIARFLSTLC